MKILCVAGKDVHNFSLINVIREIKNRNHEFELYTIYQDEIHVRMFENIEVKDIDLLTEKHIQDFDIILSSYPVAQDLRFRDLKKIIVIYSTSFTEEPYTYGDLTILQRNIMKNLISENYSVEIINRIMLKSQIAIGNPKYDSLVEKDIRSKKILFIDSGHYPFGSNGKREVAKVILKVAKSFPDYIIEIKPRFLPGDINTTHKNLDNIYFHILDESNGKLPDNLYLHEKHCNLDDCIEDAKTVITYYSTSYIDAAVAGKGLIILDELPSEESLSHSELKVNRFRKLQEKSGCLIPYENICDYLPDGLKCKEEHLKEVVYQMNDAEKSIIDVIEYLYENYINNNVFLGTCNATIDNYRKTFIVDKHCNWDYVIHYRYKSIFYADIATKLYRINDNLDFSKEIEFLNHMEENGIILSKENFDTYYNSFRELINKQIVNQKDKLLRSSLLQSYYLKALFELNELDSIQEEDVLCKAYYWHLKGKNLYGKDNELCITYLKKHLTIVENNMFEKTLADEESKIVSSNYYIGISYYNLEKYEESREYFEKCQRLTNNNHRKAEIYLERIKGQVKL